MTQVPAHLSRSRTANGLIFVSGQLALTVDGVLAGDDITTQTRQCLANIEAILEQAGAKLSDVVKTTVWLTDTKDFGAFNRVYAEYFTGIPPTRSTVSADLVVPGALIEIEALAVAH